ncbi:MAG: SMP-30/gluconolactonase/LRE family protein [Hyphomonadaceae bacterium]
MITLTASDAICVHDAKAVLGECPIWHPDYEQLFWLDIKGGCLHAYNPANGGKAKYHFEGMISAIALAAEHDFICVYEGGFAYLDLAKENVVLASIIDPEADKLGNRFNDGKIGPDGAFWAGTMDKVEARRLGTWWRLMPDARCMAVDTNYMVTNGPAFDPERRRVYLTDSADQSVFVATPTPLGIEDKRVFLQFGSDDGYPDGMCIDAEGCLWIAFWDGARVARFDTDGALLTELSLPVPRPTSLTLVGDSLFVTSARIGLDKEELSEFPLSGGLFEFTLSRGLEPSRAQPVYTPNQ